jgi:cystathionine gamma-synthase
MGAHQNKFNRSTMIARGAVDGDETTGAISVPIYQSATFRHPSLGETTGWDYSRQGNPTRKALEDYIALLEGGTRGFAFASGMAAMAAVLDLLKAGDHAVLSEDLYGGTYRLFSELAVNRGISFDFVDTSRISLLENSLRANTRLLIVETPSNPMMRVSDIAAISRIARARGILVVVDSTFLSPYFQRPLSLGAHIVLHSGTKYLAGHNDTLAGLLAAAPASDGDAGRSLADRIALIQKTTGAVLSPFDSWLLIRGMKTLAVRMERQQESARILAERLRSHPSVAKVHYVGLKDHEGYELNRSQSSGFGAMISFTLRDASFAPKVLAGVRLILFAESLGGVESLITYPMTQTHAAIPEDYRRRLGVDDRLLRLSVGLEDVEDLWTDLDQALRS